MSTSLYETLKKPLNNLITKKYRNNVKCFLRGIHSLFFIGSSVSCPICNTSFRGFIIAGNGNKVCPRCGSIGRGRSILLHLRKQHFLSPDILHFSPSYSLGKKLYETYMDSYVSTDYSGEFEADKKYDITNLQIKKNSFDIIICMHILEHINDDKLAMAELYRVLKPGGYCIIQTPYKEGQIYEDNKIVSAEQRKIHFGQEDHVRIYSIDGLIRRLEDVGFKISIMPTDKIDQERYVLSTSPILIAQK